MQRPRVPTQHVEHNYRTYFAQMDVLKKYLAKGQQTVRLERLTIERGGQAIVGGVSQWKC